MSANFEFDLGALSIHAENKNIPRNLLLPILTRVSVANEAHLQNLIFCLQELGFAAPQYTDFVFDGPAPLVPFSPKVDAHVAELEVTGFIRDSGGPQTLQVVKAVDASELEDWFDSGGLERLRDFEPDEISHLAKALVLRKLCNGDDQKAIAKAHLFFISDQQVAQDFLRDNLEQARMLSKDTPDR